MHLFIMNVHASFENSLQIRWSSCFLLAFGCHMFLCLYAHGREREKTGVKDAIFRVWCGVVSDFTCMTLLKV